jgi:hypothetical protein
MVSTSPHTDPQTELWRKFLHKDPTRFLLDPEADPSVYLWYLIDIAHRPEDSTIVTDARQRVLFSTLVQGIFAAQHADGYWESASSLSQPYYRLTLWNLAHLAELGVPRDSRRARAACEFALGNFQGERGGFVGLDLVESGYLIHALSYFRLASDERVARAASSLSQRALEADSIDALVMALWACADFRQNAEVSADVAFLRERLLDSLASSDDDRFAPITFPPFNPHDGLFISRVLALHDCAHDPRAAHLIESILEKQNERGQWPLERSLNGGPNLQSEGASPASRWATLNAARVIIRLVMSEKD